MEMKEKTLLQTSQLLEGLRTASLSCCPPTPPYPRLLSATLAPRSSRKRLPLASQQPRSCPGSFSSFSEGWAQQSWLMFYLLRVRGWW